MGKTTVANWLAAKDCTIIDTDQISHELTGPAGAALPSIVAAFSEELIGEDGALDRPKMAARVFRNGDDRRTLESILHPMIRAEWQARVSQYRGDSARHAVVVIPLLFETGVEKSFDLVACVACRALEQMQRLLSRGWTKNHAEDRIRAQWPVEEKMKQSDFVIWTSCKLDDSRRQAEEMLWLRSP